MEGIILGKTTRIQSDYFVLADGLRMRGSTTGIVRLICDNCVRSV